MEVLSDSHLTVVVASVGVNEYDRVFVSPMLIFIEEGDTVMPVGFTGSLIVTTQLFDVIFPFTTQYISVEPLDTAVTVPFSSTVVMLVFLLFQLFDVTVALLGITVKESVVFSPTFNVVEVGLIDALFTSTLFTVTEHVALLPFSSSTVTIAFPGFLPVIPPTSEYPDA